IEHRTGAGACIAIDPDSLATDIRTVYRDPQPGLGALIRVACIEGEPGDTGVVRGPTDRAVDASIVVVGKRERDLGARHRGPARANLDAGIDNAANRGMRGGRFDPNIDGATLRHGGTRERCTGSRS